MPYSVTFNDSKGQQCEIGPFDSEQYAQRLAQVLAEYLSWGSPANIIVNELDS